MEKIGILITATGDYGQFLEPLWQSVVARFLPSYPKHLFLFTDDDQVPRGRDRTILRITRRGFPGDTMYRYHYYTRAMPVLRAQGITVVYALDVDSLVAGPIGPEILPDDRYPLVMVDHPGYTKRHRSAFPLGTPETNPDSTAYISDQELRECYVVGAVVGGYVEQFAAMARAIEDQIETDNRKDLMAVWHDESHLNRYFVSHRKNIKRLPPVYCYPEVWHRHNGAGKILILEKDYHQVRGRPQGISILIPLYNGIEFLDECLASVRAQTYPFYEVLIGVNGHAPTSKVFRAAQAHESDQVRVLHYDTKGAAMTLNAMKADTRFDLLCLLDVDDKWEPDKLEQQLAVFNRYFVDVVGTQCRYFGDRDGVPPIPRGYVGPDDFLTANPIIHSSVMVQRHQVEWNDHFVFDYELWLRMAFEDQRIFFNIDQPLCWHRLHKDSFYNDKNNDAAIELREQWRQSVNSKRDRVGHEKSASHPIAERSTGATP